MNLHSAWLTMISLLIWGGGSHAHAFVGASPTSKSCKITVSQKLTTEQTQTRMYRVPATSQAHCARQAAPYRENFAGKAVLKKTVTYEWQPEILQK